MIDPVLLAISLKQLHFPWVRGIRGLFQRTLKFFNLKTSFICFARRVQMKYLKKICRGLNNLYRREILRDEPLLEAKRWFRDRGDTTLRLSYDLSPQSVVVDLGGYVGDFAYEINSRYGSTVHLFEPVPRYYAQCEKRFSGNAKVIPHCFGLGSKEGQFLLSDDNDASSFVAQLPKDNSTITAEMRAVVPTLIDLGINHIDLLKINIEGGEYDVLPALIEAGWMPKIREIQVQFHTVGDYENARDAIRTELSKTHHETWCYKFVWENWQRR